ncbi:MAG: hypothetical protein ACRD1P_01250 [Thermoanaerobaculia bacterium]
MRTEELLRVRRISIGLLSAGLAALSFAALLLASEWLVPALAVAPPGPGGATNLALAAGLSFTDDSSGNFPIRGEDLRDGRIASDRATAIFFGTSHCWNTNREAERFVALYRKVREAARFLIVDLNDPSPEQKALVARFYRGAIPTLAFLDRRGNAVYDEAGETARQRGDTSAVEEILRRAEGAR